MSILKKIFKKKEEEFVYSNKEGYGKIVYENDHTTLVHDSCRICYNKEVENTFEDKIKYIASKVKVGHESILEHSNVVIKLVVSKELQLDLLKVMNHTRYLNVITKEMDNKIEVIIGGSIRGYKHIFRNIDKPSNENKVLSIIKELMYELPYCYFTDFIEDGVMEESKFKNLDSKLEVKLDKDGNILESKRNVFKSISKEKYDILGIDNVADILDIIDLNSGNYNLYELMDMATISVKFKGVSRTASHQLVRHRAGITQLSQRYVDMTNCKFLSPDEFKPEIDGNKKYNINLFNTKKKLTLKQIGDVLNSVYPQLIEQGLLKEDARSFLTNNTETTLYMTFTLRNFIKFLELRTHKSAQAEIRELAIGLKEDFESSQSLYIGEDIYAYIEPVYKSIQSTLEAFGNVSVDEVIEVIEEKVEL